VSLRKKARKALRAKVQTEALEALAGLTREQLINMRHELSREINQLRQHADDIRLRIEAIRMELERRSDGLPTGMHVSDHAVVRYLQRFRGVDIAGVKAEIVEIAERAKVAKFGKSGVRKDSETGISLGIDDEGGNITTVFDDAELPAIARTELR